MPEPNQATGRKITLQVQRNDGAVVRIEALRPQLWIEEGKRNFAVFYNAKALLAELQLRENVILKHRVPGFAVLSNNELDGLANLVRDLLWVEARELARKAAAENGVEIDVGRSRHNRIGRPRHNKDGMSSDN